MVRWSVPCALTGGSRYYEKVVKENVNRSRSESMSAPSSPVASSCRGINPSLPTYWSGCLMLVILMVTEGLG